MFKPQSRRKIRRTNEESKKPHVTFRPEEMSCWGCFGAFLLALILSGVLGCVCSTGARVTAKV